MTIFYPDISAYQAGISLHGTVACCAKATESASYLSTDFRPAQKRAAQAGAYFFAYHFLHAGNGSGQANWCHAHVGTVPLMLDWEETPSSHPGVGDATSFIDAYRKAGGVCNLMYLPRWYWQKIGSPSLSPLAQRGMSLVSSQYTAYSDGGPGWQPYGGLTPKVWQYTDNFLFNGQRIDFNAFKGSLDQLKALAGKGSVPPSGDPTITEGDSGPAVTKMQNRLNTWGANPVLALDGKFGPASTTALKTFQGRQHLTVDGICGPSSWHMLNNDPHKTVPTVPPGQWKNPNEWTWTDAALTGHGLDGRVHNFSYNTTTGGWDRHA